MEVGEEAGEEPVLTPGVIVYREIFEVP